MNKNKRWDQEIYLRALHFAAKAHKEQKVPGMELPYVIHSVSVCMEIMAAITMEGMANPDLAVQCALLHDTVEDTETDIQDIKILFGPDVAAGVGALTKNHELPEEQRMGDSLERIKKMPDEIAAVKLADRITNLQPPPSHWDRHKISLYREEAILIFENLEEASPFLAERLRVKINGYGAGSKL
ncbi:MAG TPA: HD domain-containing protein [Spirochaetota bacterium]|nr:HD domain-containing protein [Spirochaetota bacterium]